METKKQKQINVLICDDEPGIRNDLRDHLNEFARLRDLDIRIGEFESAEELLASHEAFDVLFLDIYLDGMDGTDAAWQLNTQERKRTVFLTSSQDHAIEAYQIGASHYLLKPIDFEVCSRRSSAA